MRIAVLGASGFVGATTVELLTSRGVDVVPVINSTGNAWRLTRLAIVPKLADFMDRHQADTVLDGCTHVINCMRGDDQAMLVGIDHALHAAMRAKVQKFVHLSSVAVYGDPPPASASSEDAPTNPAKGGYGWVKLVQDQKVQKAAKSGLPSVILCPPNIIGPYSRYLLGVLDTVLQGEFALLGDGSAVCNVVDVQNLATSCIAALESTVSDGTRFFVTEDDRVSWAQLITSLAAEARVLTPPPSISEAELRRRIPVSIALVCRLRAA